MSTSFLGRVVYYASNKRFCAPHIEEEMRAYEDLRCRNIEKYPVVSNSIEDLLRSTWDESKLNPYNWGIFHKILFSIEVSLLTTVVYMSSALYTPGITQIMEEFSISNRVALIPLTMFVIGYGIGTMLFSPLSEEKKIGRAALYVLCTFLFFVFQIPIALCTSITALSILRFWAGFFGSPALATCGASLTDVYSLPYMPVGLGIWGLAAWCGPSIGPFFGSILTTKGGWRWNFWFQLICSGGLLVMTIVMPETSAKTLIYWRQMHMETIILRKTKNDILSLSEKPISPLLTALDLKSQSIYFLSFMKDIFWRPLAMTIEEPVLILINFYITLVYCLLYLWFEAFPIVFSEIHGFPLILTGISYLSIICGVIIGASFYLYYLYVNFTKKLLNHENVFPEVFIPPAIVGSVQQVIALFIFAWTSSRDIHWIFPLIGCSIYGSSGIINFQSLLNYLGMSFPHYVASAFASNNLFRSVIAGVFPLFGRNLYTNLATEKFPVGWGTSILGFISVLMCLIPLFFYKYGPSLRARSRFAGDDGSK